MSMQCCLMRSLGLTCSTRRPGCAQCLRGLARSPGRTRPRTVRFDMDLHQELRCSAPNEAREQGCVIPCGDSTVSRAVCASAFAARAEQKGQTRSATHFTTGAQYVDWACPAFMSARANQCWMVKCVTHPTSPSWISKNVYLDTHIVLESEAVRSAYERDGCSCTCVGRPERQ